MVGRERPGAGAGRERAGARGSDRACPRGRAGACAGATAPRTQARAAKRRRQAFTSRAIASDASLSFTAASSPPRVAASTTQCLR